MIVLGVDPGLTRCGVGVIEAGAYRRLSFIHVDVVRSDPHESQDLRLLKIYDGLCAKMDEFIPDTVSIERVFAQENLSLIHIFCASDPSTKVCAPVSTNPILR